MESNSKLIVLIILIKCSSDFKGLRIFLVELKWSLIFSFLEVNDFVRFFIKN